VDLAPRRPSSLYTTNASLHDVSDSRHPQPIHAASEVAGTSLQVHGGIGFTWEHDLHLLLRRIKVDEAVDGTVAEHRLALVAG